MKRLILAVIALLSIGSAKGYEDYNKNEVVLGVSGGLSALQYSVSEGDYDPGVGTSVSLNYIYHLNKNWGIGTGAGVALYQSSVRYNTFSDSYNVGASPIISGTDGSNLEFMYNYSELRDKQSLLYVNIPIFVQYQSDFGLYARVGAEIGIPAVGGSTIYYTQLNTSAYSSYTNATYNNLPSHGLGTYTYQEKDISLNFLTNASLTGEVGWNWNWENQYRLYIGVTGSYGLLNVYKRESNQPQLVYNNGDLQETPIWNANKNNDTNDTLTGDRVNTYSFGLVLRYSIGW